MAEHPALDIRRHEPDQGPFGKFFAASSDMASALRAEAREADILHTHGLWLSPNVYPATAVRKTGARAKLVMSPRGMLGKEALAFSSIRKRLAWIAFQRRAIQQADCLHATAESELEEIRAAGLTNPVAVIPNGIHVPSLPAMPRTRGGARTVLSLSRLHPKKGLDRLLHAWSMVEGQRPDWRLRIVGPPEGGYDEALKALAHELSLTRVSIEGPAFGDDKSAAYWNAELFVLPSLNENFAMTVAEALTHGVPVISTQGAPWAGLKTQSCGWWIDHGPTLLAQTLLIATNITPDALSEMGARGRAWMAQDFSWNRVGDEVLGVYRWLVDGGPTPRAVSV